MYSREETQKLKQEFWIAFAEKHPRKWILYDTKIKDFSFKFYVDNKKAQVLIDIEHKNEGIRIQYFEKLQSFKNILEHEYISDLIYEKEYSLENGKIISRVWIEKQNISVSNSKDWNEIFDFFYEKMNALEYFYLEYSEIIKNINT